MAHLVCKAHGRRVMTFDGKIIHRGRGTGSHCKNTDMRMGDKTWRATNKGLVELAVSKKGNAIEVPVKHLTKF